MRKHTTSSFGFFLASAFACVACTERESELPAVPDADACPSGVILTGAKLRWEKLNHRISLWGIEPATGVCGTGGLDMTASYVGGDWTTGETGKDRAMFEASGTVVESPGNIGFYHVEKTVNLTGPGWEHVERLEVDLATAHLGGFEKYAVLVRGLRLATDVPQQDPAYPMPGDGGGGYDPKYGWTTRGISLFAENVTVQGGRLFFDARIRFAPGPSDRSNMNAAMPHATVEARALFQIVGLKDAQLSESTVTYRLTYPPPEPFYLDDGQAQPHASMDQRRFHVPVPREGMLSVTGAGGWSWDLNPDGKNGYYIRELSWFIKPVSYDAGTKSLVMDADGYASHTSILMYDAMDHIFTVKAVTISLPAGSLTRASAKGTFEVGTLKSRMVPE
jgi:hypothetical protein